MGRWGVNSVNNLHLQRIHSWPRAIALHCLLTQAGHSLMAQKKQMAVPLWDDRLFFLCAHYIKDKYKFLMSSKVGSFGLPGRHASSIADCARKSTSSALTIAFKSAGIPTSADSFLTASTAALRYSSWQIKKPAYILLTVLQKMTLS